MKKSLLSIFTTCLCFGAFGQQLTWVSTTRAEHWKPMSLSAAAGEIAANTVIHTDSTRQQITGFGGCFNELGWQSLQILPAGDQKTIFTELFSPGIGANFTICRMPVGANDFADSWYSYDEKPGDFSLSSFNIARDERALIPFIKTAQLYNPVLKLWASPWSPPTWMKTNGKYAAGMVPSHEVIAQYKARGVSMTGMDFSHVENGLKPGESGREDDV